MARPQPIIAPVERQIEGSGQTQAGQAIGQLLGQLLGRGIQQRGEADKQAAFKSAFPGLFPTVEATAAGPQLPAEGAPAEALEGAALAPRPTGQGVPENVQALTQLLSGSPQGRQIGQQFATQQAFERAEPTKPGEQFLSADLVAEIGLPEGTQITATQAQKIGAKISPDAGPDSIFGKISDITKFTPKSVAAAEKSGKRGDLIVKDEFLQNKVKGKDKFDAEKDLRKEFAADAKVFKDTRDAFSRIRAVGGSKTAAGDLALIFNFMKMLDPGSVVRESEFRSAEQAKSWLVEAEGSGLVIPSFVKTAIQKADPEQKGAFLLPPQREDFIGQANNIMKEQSSTHKQRETQFSGIAKRNKLDVRNVILDLNDPEFEKSLKEVVVEETGKTEEVEDIATFSNEQLLAIAQGQ